MKLLVSVSIALVAIVFVWAENCQHPSDCNLEICAANVSHVACHHGVCTCDPERMTTCTSMQDCHNTIHCRDNLHHIHCIDGHCDCLPDRPQQG